MYLNYILIKQKIHQYINVNKNNHTTSTKCQYHAAASNPKWWEDEIKFILIRYNEIIKNDVPMITWIPWKPVVIKNVLPKILSLIENWAWAYSHLWRKVNVIPRIIVIIREIKVSFKLLLIILWWDHEIEIPEEIKIVVFKRGISNGLKGIIFIGGHILPISIFGDNLLWKNAQKKEIKKKISEIIKRIIPNFNPITTFDEWEPWKEASRDTSRHHWNKVKIKIIKAK